MAAAGLLVQGFAGRWGISCLWHYIRRSRPKSTVPLALPTILRSGAGHLVLIRSRKWPGMVVSALFGSLEGLGLGIRADDAVRTHHAKVFWLACRVYRLRFGFDGARRLINKC